VGCWGVLPQPDPQHPEAINTNDGCHIDQIFGQSWAGVGLPRVLPIKETRSALEALWRYNFTPTSDLTARIQGHPGRTLVCDAWRGGLPMCTGRRAVPSGPPGGVDVCRLLQ
jgi:hypothetical protein